MEFEEFCKEIFEVLFRMVFWRVVFLVGGFGVYFSFVIYYLDYFKLIDI